MSIILRRVSILLILFLVGCSPIVPIYVQLIYTQFVSPIWSKDNTQLAFTLSNWYSKSQENKSLEKPSGYIYLINTDGSQLKLVKTFNTPSVSLKGWSVSKDKFLISIGAGVSLIDINGNLKGHFKTLDSGSLENASAYFSPDDGYISVYGFINKISGNIRAGSLLEVIKLQILDNLQTVDSKEFIFEIPGEEMNELTQVAQAILSPRGDRVYFVNQKTLTEPPKLFHAYGYLDAATSQVTQVKKFLEYTTINRDDPVFKFVGWRDEDTLVYGFAERSSKEKSLFSYNISTEETKKIGNLNTVWDSFITHKQISSDLKQIAYTQSEKTFLNLSEEQNLYISNLDGSNRRHILNITHRLPKGDPLEISSLKESPGIGPFYSSRA